MTDAPPRVLSKFEGRLVNLVRAAVRLAPPESAAPFLTDKLSAPPGLSSYCMELVCSALAHGCVLYLCRQGWREEKYLRDGAPVTGRLWQRSPGKERALQFSHHALDFLLALTAGGAMTVLPDEDATPADQLLVFLTYDAFRGSEAAVGWRTRPVFSTSPLCRLVWPDDFPSRAAHPPAFAGWGQGLRASILEALQSKLAERWLYTQQALRLLGDADAIRSAAEAMDETLDGVLAEIGPARRDLAGFLVDAATDFCQSGISLEDVAGRVNNRGLRLTDRLKTVRAAAILPRALIRLGEWERQARAIGYLDDGYAAAQFYLARWEQAGAVGALAVARDVVRQTEPLTPAKESRDEPGVPGEGERE
ncbi:MAG: hypothetical protein K1X57_01765 [Gemmataceae bacterium]|nr:hypothetical protein [Gemmataceae bacterium]